MLDAKKNNNSGMYVQPNNLLEVDTLKNITIRKDGTYMGRKQINGKRVAVYGKTEKECLRKLKQTKTIIKKLNEKQETNYKLYEWLDNWYVTYKAKFVSYATAKNIENVIKTIKSQMENINLDKLTTNQIQNVLNSFPTSRKKEFISLYFNACLQKAEDINLIIKNPFKAVVKEKRQKNIRDSYSLEEQKIILEEIKGTEIEPVVLFYLITGIRKNELKTFYVDRDLNEKTHTIKIKSEKKTNPNKQFREIDVTDNLIKIIKNNKQAFSLKPDYIYRKLKSILDKHNIKSGLHRLRHTFATNHYYLKTPVKTVSEWMGHETVELTQNIYTHIDRSITKEDILKLYNNLYFLTD